MLNRVARCAARGVAFIAPMSCVATPVSLGCLLRSVFKLGMLQTLAWALSAAMLKACVARGVTPVGVPLRTSRRHRPSP